MPSAIQSQIGSPGVAGALQGLDMGGALDWLGNASMGRVLQVACYRDNSDGVPAGMPSLRLDNWGFWRFFLGVSPGTVTVTVWAKQVANQTPYPSVVLKKNTAIGLAVDTTFPSPGGNDWQAITASFVATASGVVVVELHNNLNTVIYCPCLFSGPQFGVWNNGVPLLTTNLTSGSASVGATVYRVSATQPRHRQP